MLGVDKIVVINPDNPAQHYDIVDTHVTDQQFTDPMWSPDGQILIVFSVNSSQPYKINIAQYLQSQGAKV